MAVMTNGCWVDGSLFEAASEKLRRNCTVNVNRYAHMVGQAFVNTTRAQSVWINRRGVARRGFYFKVDGRTRNVITVEMGGKAPNYKKGKHSADDYMEYLEFDFDRRYAIIYPVHEAMMASIRSDLPDVVVKGKTQAPKIAHSKLANYKRTQRARGKYGYKSGIRGRRYL